MKKTIVAICFLGASLAWADEDDEAGALCPDVAPEAEDDSALVLPHHADEEHGGTSERPWGVPAV